MKAALKLLLPLLFLSTAISGLLFTSGCKEDLVSGDTTTVANSNVKVFRNIVINEYINDASLSSIDLYAGTNIDANNAVRDAELVDSTGIGPGYNRYWLRSGDGTQDVIGQETKFIPLFSSRTAGDYQSQYDAMTRIDVGHADPVTAADFYRYSTYSMGLSFVSTDVRVYGFWLKGKKVSLGLSNEVYGLMYIKSIAGPVGSYKMTVDVKINTKGQNDLRERIPSTN